MKTSIPTLAHQTLEVINGETYESLEAFSHLSLNELPEGVRTAMSLIPKMLWDGTTPDGRRQLARQHDSRHDPAMGPENAHWYELTWKIGDCEREIEMWGSMQHQSISEAVQKEEKLTELNAKMAALQLQWSAPYTAPAQNTAMPAPVAEPVKRKTKKPSIESLAFDYMRNEYKSGQFKSAATFHKHLTKAAGVKDSPFEMGTGTNARKLFCPAAGSFFEVGTLSKVWPKIRAA